MIREIEKSKIKEIIFCWDWARAIIPGKHVKKLMYTGLKNECQNNSYECDYVYLKIDLEYVKKSFYYTGNNIDYYRQNNISHNSEATIYKALENYNIWDIEIIYKDGTYIILNLPSKTVNDVWSKNLWEQHQEIDNYLKLLWITPNMTKQIRKKKIYESKNNKRN